MLSTGIRTDVGVKFMGSLDTIEALAQKIKRRWKEPKE
jgi:Cu/Ag efflux pump CusA